MSTGSKSISKSSQQSELTNSQRYKWIKSYVTQQQKLNPDQIQFKLKYHLLLITEKRTPLFSDQHFTSFSNIFAKVTKSFSDTYIEVLWIGSDHIHLYLDTSPDYSVDEISQTIIQDSQQFILMEHSELQGNNQRIWKNNYFVETIG